MSSFMGTRCWETQWLSKQLPPPVLGLSPIHRKPTCVWEMSRAAVFVWEMNSYTSASLPSWHLCPLPHPSWEPSPYVSYLLPLNLLAEFPEGCPIAPVAIQDIFPSCRSVEELTVGNSDPASGSEGKIVSSLSCYHSWVICDRVQLVLLALHKC